MNALTGTVILVLGYVGLFFLTVFTTINVYSVGMPLFYLPYFGLDASWFVIILWIMRRGKPLTRRNAMMFLGFTSIAVVVFIVPGLFGLGGLSLYSIPLLALLAYYYGWSLNRQGDDP